MKRAFARSESLSEPERLFIKSHYHYIVTGRLDDVVAAYRLWIATYPDDWVPHNNLSTTYARLNETEQALDEGRAAVTLGANSVVAYQQLTRALLALDRLADVKDVIPDATAKGLESSLLHQLAFDLAFIDQDTAGMQEHLRAASSRRRLPGGDRGGPRRLRHRRHRRQPDVVRPRGGRGARRAHQRLRRQPDRGAGAQRRAGPDVERARAELQAATPSAAARRRRGRRQWPPRSRAGPPEAVQLTRRFRRAPRRRPTSSTRSRCRCCRRRSRWRTMTATARAQPERRRPASRRPLVRGCPTCTAWRTTRARTTCTRHQQFRSLFAQAGRSADQPGATAGAAAAGASRARRRRPRPGAPGLRRLRQRLAQRRSEHPLLAAAGREAAASRPLPRPPPAR